MCKTLHPEYAAAAASHKCPQYVDLRSTYFCSRSQGTHIMRATFSLFKNNFHLKNGPLISSKQPQARPTYFRTTYLDILGSHSQGPLINEGHFSSGSRKPQPGSTYDFDPLIWRF